MLWTGWFISLLVSLLVPSLHAFDAPAGIRIRRMEADTSFLFPKNAKRLMQFYMDSTYGSVRPLSSAWVQRGVIDATVQSDLFSRLAYYDDKSNTDNRGALLIAETVNDNTLVGFVDVGACLWIPDEDPAFQLPSLSEKRTTMTAGNEMRPYVSNLVVDESMRRRSVGKSLMAACEKVATSFDEGLNTIWLEVTSTNQVALDFYKSLGYIAEQRSPGTEMMRQGDTFQMTTVQRCLLRKELSPIPES
jgi:ribosomal protein S18 acetylase RimI-like enzyme